MRATVLWAVLLMVTAVALGESAPPDGQRVLFVGNSMTYFWGMPLLVAQLGRHDSPPLTVQVRTLVGGNRSMQDYWEDGQFLKALDAGPYDAIVLQRWEKKGQGNDLSVYIPKMVAEIRRRHPSTRILLYMVDSGAVFATDDRQQHGAATLEFQAIDAVKRYREFQQGAAELDAAVLPTSIAWARATRQREPMLQWYFGPGDGHPSPKRQYLTACILYAALFDRDPVGNPYRKIGLPTTPAERQWVPGDDGQWVFSRWGRDWIRLQREDGKTADVQVSHLGPADQEAVRNATPAERRPRRTWQIPANPYGLPKVFRDGSEQEIRYMQTLARDVVREHLKMDLKPVTPRPAGE